MHRNQKVACVIPARLASTRFPKKMLSQVGGKPLLHWVYMAVQKCHHFDTAVFAIDSDEVARVLDGIGAPYVMTDPSCPSGTDRLIEVRSKGAISADVWVNWQGDEPFITPEMIDDLLQSCDDPMQDIWTLMHAFKKNIDDPSIVKVVTDLRGKALYFSRSPIPYGDINNYFRHIGLYAYSDRALSVIERLRPSDLEQSEGLEQLRFLENGLYIQMHETQHESQGVDLPEHIALVEDLLNIKSFI